MARCVSVQCPLLSHARIFTSKEELMAHAQESRALHPLCVPCERVFQDKESCVQHMDAKHAVYCMKCSRKYHSPGALEQHFRASSHHPNCPRCGSGLENRAALDRHIVEEHPKVRCCGVQMFQDELDTHFLNSVNHPHCPTCSAGFASQGPLDEHMATSHLPETWPCAICARTFGSSEELELHSQEPGRHPRCEFCNQAFRDTSAVIEHYFATHSDSRTPPAIATPRAAEPMSACVYPLAIGSERMKFQTPAQSYTSSMFVTASPQSMASTSTMLSALCPQPPPPPPFTRTRPRSPEAGPHDRRKARRFDYSAATTAASTPTTSRTAPPPGKNASSGAATPTALALARHALLSAPPSPPMSAHSRTSTGVAETPSGDLANFELLNGSPVEYEFPPKARRQDTVRPGAPASRFYCRVCLADPCEDVTATACGHLFCYGCISREVRQHARCPVCSAAVLLFALLRLDV